MLVMLIIFKCNQLSAFIHNLDFLALGWTFYYRHVTSFPSEWIISQNRWSVEFRFYLICYQLLSAVINKVKRTNIYSEAENPLNKVGNRLQFLSLLSKSSKRLIWTSFIAQLYVLVVHVVNRSVDFIKLSKVFQIRNSNIFYGVCASAMW